MVLVKVANQATNVKRKRRGKMEEFEIDWIPEDTGAPYEAVEQEIPAHTVDKICRSKYGHVNWARLEKMTPSELSRNPCVIDYAEGIVYFKNRTLV